MQNDTNSNSIIALKDVTKSYEGGKLLALHDIRLSIAQDEFVCIVGPSGCGKSTLLKLIAGLIEPDYGTVSKPSEVSMVFQSGALLPWLSVFENAALGLRAKHVSQKEVERLVSKYLDMVGLLDMARKYPRELSGGQRQRVGIARALAVEPKVLLLDEPFSALDPVTTEELHGDLLKIWKEAKVTMVMVSHLIEEATALADRVVLMKAGKIDHVFPVELPYPRRESGLKFHELVLSIRKEFFA